MATPNNFRVKNGLTVSNGVTISAGNVVITSGQLVIGATAINATSLSDGANNAYTNAIAIAANASNLTSGTVAIARIPTADSVSNTSISHVPTANNVKTAYDAAIAANTLANTAATSAGAAYTNAVSYTDTKIGTANTAITGNAATAYTNSVSYTDTKIGTANTAMAANADAAYTNAVSYTDGKILTSNSAITGNAATAYTNAITIAANADNLTSGTVNIARIPVIDAINNTSISFVATANSVKTAYDAAIAANTLANTAATAASAAYTNATIFAANASNANNGTLAEARLPHRMNQDVRNSDSPTFANGSFTGSLSVGGTLTITGNLISQNVQSLAVADPLIKLGVNNASDVLWGGFTFHYSGSGNTTNHAGLVRSPTSKEFLLMSTFGDETSVFDNNVINIADPSFSYANLTVNILKAGNSTVFSTINTTSFSGVSGFFTETVNAASYTVGSSFIANSTGITSTGFANVTSTIQGGSSLTIAGAASGITTLAAGNTTITGFANVSVAVNTALLSVGSSFIANTLGAFHTGTMNAASYTVGSYFTVNSISLSSSGGTFVANADGISVSGSINAACSSFIANSSGITTTGFANVSSTLQVGNNITNGLGNTSAPSYTFTGDTDTGMFSPAANTLAFSTAGAEVARLTSAGYLEAVYSDDVVALGNTGTAKSIDLRQGTVFTATLTGNCTFTLANPNANANRGSSFTLILTNDGTGSRTVAWAGGAFRFPGGAATVSRTATANAVDIWVFFTPDNGTTWYGNISMKDVKA
jgi:hypothetical protein